MAWRRGTKVGRTIYLDGKLVGLMDTPELAKRVIEALNYVENATTITIDWIKCGCTHLMLFHDKKVGCLVKRCKCKHKYKLP